MQDETCAGQFGFLAPLGWHGGYFCYTHKGNGGRDCALTYKGLTVGGAVWYWVTLALELSQDPATAARWPSEVATAWRIAAGAAQGDGERRAAAAFMGQADAWAGLCAAGSENFCRRAP